MAVEALLPTLLIFDMQDGSYFGADEDKSFICNVFIEAERMLLSAYAEFCII